MNYIDNGMLTVRAYTAGGALPVAKSVVKIIGADENNRFVEFSLVTDVDGSTQKIALPSPPKSLSLSPGAQDVPYAVYDIEISADGYYTKRITNVAVFSGTEALQLINMIPISIENGEIYPRGNLDTLVLENEYL